MFKYYLNLNNDVTYRNMYEIHKKTCPLVKQALEANDEAMLEMGFFETCSQALEAAKEALSERDMNPALLNGCLACNKECHKR